MGDTSGLIICIASKSVNSNPFILSANVFLHFNGVTMLCKILVSRGSENVGSNRGHPFLPFFFSMFC